MDFFKVKKNYQQKLKKIDKKQKKHKKNSNQILQNSGGKNLRAPQVHMYTVPNHKSACLGFWHAPHKHEVAAHKKPNLRRTQTFLSAIESMAPTPHNKPSCEWNLVPGIGT